MTDPILSDECALLIAEADLRWAEEQRLSEQAPVVRPDPAWPLPEGEKP